MGTTFLFNYDQGKFLTAYIVECDVPFFPVPGVYSPQRYQVRFAFDLNRIAT